MLSSITVALASPPKPKPIATKRRLGTKTAPVPNIIHVAPTPVVTPPLATKCGSTFPGGRVRAECNYDAPEATPITSKPCEI